VNRRVALVTGGAGPGMGRAICRALAEQESFVIVADLNPHAAEAVAEDLRVSGMAAQAVPLDITEAGSCDRVVEGVLRDHGRLDVLCNHAGATIGGMKPVDSVTDDEWARCIAVNLTGAFLMTRAALKPMIAQGAGAIVNTISAAGLRGGSGAAYVAAKHGLVGLTRQVAWSYALSGVRCNGVCPGGVAEAADQSGAQATLAADPNPYGWARAAPVIALMPRVGLPREMAAIVRFLASDEASYLNGAIIAADAGWTAA
jgi:NAD(P)-dependent dehydrogenase (short-subunit alcohol dehydrogenase family)